MRFCGTASKLAHRVGPTPSGMSGSDLSSDPLRRLRCSQHRPYRRDMASSQREAENKAPSREP